MSTTHLQYLLHDSDEHDLDRADESQVVQHKHTAHSDDEKEEEHGGAEDGEDLVVAEEYWNKGGYGFVEA